MAKKKSEKEVVTDEASTNKVILFSRMKPFILFSDWYWLFFRCILLLALSSFFFTGAADQSIIDAGNSQELASVNNHVKNYAGSRGAHVGQLPYKQTVLGFLPFLFWSFWLSRD
jgi:S-DNA-T family DNA segregation ATPase FtsK/SpoIIIE